MIKKTKNLLRVSDLEPIARWRFGSHQLFFRSFCNLLFNHLNLGVLLKLVFLFLKQNIESGKRTIDARDILLKIYFVFIA